MFLNICNFEIVPRYPGYRGYQLFPTLGGQKMLHWSLRKSRKKSTKPKRQTFDVYGRYARKSDCNLIYTKISVKQDNKKIKEQDRYLICPDRVKDGHFIGFICSLDESQTDR